MSPAPDRQALQETILRIVAARIGQDVSQVPTQKSFAELGLQSLDALDIMFDLEDEFQVSIPDDEARKVDSVESLLDLMSRILASS